MDDNGDLLGRHRLSFLQNFRVIAPALRHAGIADDRRGHRHKLLRRQHLPRRNVTVQPRLSGCVHGIKRPTETGLTANHADACAAVLDENLFAYPHGANQVDRQPRGNVVDRLIVDVLAVQDASGQNKPVRLWYLEVRIEPLV